MNKANRNALLGITLAILAGLGIAIAGSQGGARVSGIPLFASMAGACTSIDSFSRTNSPTPGMVHSSFPESISPKDRYLFYLHGKIIEDEGPDAISPQFGPYEFEEIVRYLADAGYEVIGEVRTSPTDVSVYATHVADQVQALLAQGVLDRNITIVGFSKGAGIAIITSTELKNSRSEFRYPGILCG